MHQSGVSSSHPIGQIRWSRLRQLLLFPGFAYASLATVAVGFFCTLLSFLFGIKFIFFLCWEKLGESTFFPPVSQQFFPCLNVQSFSKV